MVSKNTDLFVLMVFAFASCSMKIDHGKYINNENVVKYLGYDLTWIKKIIHAITGCDTKYFMFSVGKVKVLKKCMKQAQKDSLLNEFNSFQQLITKYLSIYQN